MLQILQQLDTARLFQIAARLISVETVQDAQEFAQKVQDAAQIAIAAALRIAGLETDARALHTPEQSARIDAAIAIYAERA